MTLCVGTRRPKGIKKRRQNYSADVFMFIGRGVSEWVRCKALRAKAKERTCVRD